MPTTVILPSNSETRQELLARHGVTPAAAALFCALHYGITIPPAELPCVAASEIYSGGEATINDCRDALAVCFAKGWLQVIDESALHAITQELRTHQIHGPIYGLPNIGAVDFTHQGATIWESLDNRQSSEPKHPGFTFGGVVHEQWSRFFPDRGMALAAMEELRTWESVTAVAGPLAIGPWRVQWWRSYREGFRIEVEEKHPTEGCGPRGDHWWWDHPLDLGANLPRLRDTLDCHNVRLEEWLVLSTLDNVILVYPFNLSYCVSRTAKKAGITVPQDLCQSAMEACVKNGWIRVLDEAASVQIYSHLEREPALSPLYEKRGIAQAHLDYTATGVDLYKMIASEVFGPRWDAGISLTQERYRKEHRYAETEEGIRNTLQGFADCGEPVVRSDVKPIGPWCVWWWDRYPSGFKLVVEIEAS